MKKLSPILMILSAIALIFTLIAFFFKYEVLNVAGTQWILVAILLSIYSAGNQKCSCDCCKKEQVN